MKPYGLTRTEHGDTDTRGVIDGARATAVYGAEHPPRALRRGRKAARRRAIKRRERAAGERLARVEVES